MADTIGATNRVRALSGGLLLLLIFYVATGIVEQSMLKRMTGRVLFEYGVDVVSGTKVVDEESVLRHISQGATFKQVQGGRLLTLRRNKPV